MEIKADIGLKINKAKIGINISMLKTYATILKGVDIISELV